MEPAKHHTWHSQHVQDSTGPWGLPSHEDVHHERPHHVITALPSTQDVAEIHIKGACCKDILGYPALALAIVNTILCTRASQMDTPVYALYAGGYVIVCTQRIQVPAELKAAPKFTVTCDYMRLVDPLEKHSCFAASWLSHCLQNLFI